MVDIIEDYGRTMITHDYKRFWIGRTTVKGGDRGGHMLSYAVHRIIRLI